MKLCLAVLTASFTTPGISYVCGICFGEKRTARVCRRVRERRSQAKYDPNSEAQRLTLKITGAQSYEDFIHVVEKALETPIFNHFHASAAYKKLARWVPRSHAAQKGGMVVSRLHTRVQEMASLGVLDAQGSANVLWGLARLLDASPSARQLIEALSLSIPKQTFKMVPQALSNCLWAAARLEEVEPRVLNIVPSLVEEIPRATDDMKPQELSNSLWAAAQLKETQPSVLKMIPALLEQIPRKQGRMIPQDLANSLLALFVLEDSVPEITRILRASDDGTDNLVTVAARRLNNRLPELSGRGLALDVSTILWACARVELYHQQLLVSIAERFGSSMMCSTLGDWCLCSMAWSFEVLDTGGFQPFREVLSRELEKRGFSDAEVQRSQRGPFDWDRATK